MDQRSVLYAIVTGFRYATHGMLITVMLNTHNEFTVRSDQFRTVQHEGTGLNWVDRSLEHNRIREGLQVVVRCRDNNGSTEITDWCFQKDYERAHKLLNQFRKNRSDSTLRQKSRAVAQ